LEIKAKRKAKIPTESIYGKAIATSFAHAAQSYIEGGGNHRFVLPLLNFFRTTPSWGKFGGTDQCEGKNRNMINVLVTPNCSFGRERSRVQSSLAAPFSSTVSQNAAGVGVDFRAKR
jgi:hypothetical protein